MSRETLLIVLVLGVYRLAHMVVYEDGPFEVFTELRSLAANRLGSRHWVTKGINCTLCTSWWFALPAAIAGAWLIGWWGPEGALLWPGLAGAALLLDALIAALYRIGGRE